MITSHTVGQPEVELTGPDTATATWALQDLVIDTSRQFTVRGASFYFDEYRKVDGEWRIAQTGYKRIYEELANGPTTCASPPAGGARAARASSPPSKTLNP